MGTKYHFCVDYADHNIVIGIAGETLEAAQACLDENVNYYKKLRYPIRDAYLYQICETCHELWGRILRCRSPKRHARGIHPEKCYKVCPTCKGKYEMRITKE